MTHRIDRLKNTLNKKGMDSIFITHPANISYLVCSTIRDSYLLICDDINLLITDSRYTSEYENIIKGTNISIKEIHKDLIKTIKDINKTYKIKNLAFEQDHVSLSFYLKLKRIFGKRLLPTKSMIEKMRMIKDLNEVNIIRQAVHIALCVFKDIKKVLRPGISELQLAAEIERCIRLRGATSASFEIIVASGSNSSFPHAKKTNRKIQKNEPIIVDLGVDYKGYKSDLTRMFFLGKMTLLHKKIYRIVKTAQQKAKALIRPGVIISEVDKAARDFIKKQDFGDCFKHSLGHGIGLEVHESPKISSKNKKRLKAGMVVTIEPAIYLGNKFGIRIEDMILVTSKGMEDLSGLSD